MAESRIDKPFSKRDLISSRTDTFLWSENLETIAIQVKSGNTVLRLQLQSDEGGSLRLFKSTDNGANWTLLKNFYP